MIRNRSASAWLLAILLLAATALGDRSRAEEPEPLSAFPQSLLAIRTAAGTVIDFQIWTANTPKRDQQGLMFVHDMDDHAGMLFVFPTDQAISMWMKNTYMSLDMLFVAADGRINAIVARTTPLSERIISPPVLSRAVLEIKGGIAEQTGIKAGDVLIHRAFGNAK
jgi:uncharacterized membrane protein (UPF0127 family)